MPISDAAPEIAIIASAVACLLYSSFAPHRLQWVSAGLALAGLAVAAVLLGEQLGRESLTFSGVIAIDGASVLSRLLIVAASATCILLAPTWFVTDRRHGEYYALLLFSTLGAMLMASASDLLQLTIAVLLSSVTGYTLAAYHRDWGPSVEAGMKYFLIGALANAILAIGVVLVLGMLGTSGYAGLGERMAGGGLSPLALLGLALMLAGLAFKLGAVPGHAWVPDVAEGAPAPAAAFLTVVPKIGAAIALARLIALMPPEEGALRLLIALIALLTMTLGNLAAIWQEDVRRLLGYSSVSQSGYALMAVAVVGIVPEAMRALLVFLLAYSAANLAAFALVVSLRGRTAIDDYEGLARAHPALAVAFAVALLSLVGIPPLIGFFGKLELFRLTIDAGLGWLAVAAALNTVVSLFYYLRVIGRTAFVEPKGQVATLDRTSVAVALAAAAFSVGLGIAASLLIELLSGATLLP